MPPPITSKKASTTHGILFFKEFLTAAYEQLVKIIACPNKATITSSTTFKKSFICTVKAQQNVAYFSLRIYKWRAFFTEVWYATVFELESFSNLWIPFNSTFARRLKKFEVNDPKSKKLFIITRISISCFRQQTSCLDCFKKHRLALTNSKVQTCGMVNFPLDISWIKSFTDVSTFCTSSPNSKLLHLNSSHPAI